MAALPYIQLYVADYLADTMHLQAEEHGAYLMLIFNYWQTGKPIPKNRLQSISRVSNDRWSFVETTLSEFFTDTGTHWQHSRIDSDLAMVDEAQRQRSAAGKASVEAKRRAKQAEIKRKGNQRSTTVDVSLKQDANESDTDTDTDTDTEYKNITPTVFVISDGESPPEITDDAFDLPVIKREKIPLAEIIAIYHEVLPANPECKKLTTRRAGQIRQRWGSGDLPDLQTWRDYFEHVSHSDFLCGRAPPTEKYPIPFKADIDFLINESNYAKIYEGKYHGQSRRPSEQIQPARLSTVQRASLIAQRGIDAYEAQFSAAGIRAAGSQAVEVNGGIARRSLG